MAEIYENDGNANSSESGISTNQSGKSPHPQIIIWTELFFVQVPEAQRGDFM